MKRGRDGSLTGGSGDVNPQWLSTSVTQSAADTTTTAQVNLPIQRLPTGGSSRAQVLEVLRVVFTWPSYGVIGAVGESGDTMAGFLSTVSFGTTATTMSEPRVFAGFNNYQRGAFTAGGTYGYVAQQEITFDLSDGQGHGLLIATDSIFFQANSGGTGSANTFRAKILYRMKNIGLAEYVGIVQSQQ